MSTIDFYNSNAENYIQTTLNADMSAVYKEFLQYVPDGGRILDLGCGSGRDSKYFLVQGYDVVSIDGAEELCKYASQITGRTVVNMRFEDIDYDEEFDAVWACASLLHIKKDNMRSQLLKISDGLKAEGIFYASYKYGCCERTENGRHYSDYTQEELTEIFSETGFETVKCWESVDKLNRNNRWINIIARKV